jgi:nucleotide-binding universal stress UspA family protein
MSTGINSILVPIGTEASSLEFAQQAAGFAREHHARLSLLHMADIQECKGRFLGLFNFEGALSLHRITNEKTALLHTWKQTLEEQYGIPVTVTVDWGKPVRTLTRHLREQGTDLLLLKQAPAAKGRGFSGYTLRQVIDQSPCQVMTLLSDAHSLCEWKQVVLPVSGYIPEARINALLGIAGKLPLKVHLLSMRDGDTRETDPDFYFITETLKRIKTHGHIQVECRHLHGTDRIQSFLQYAGKVGADLLMTNMHRDKDSAELPREAFYFMDYA